MQRTTYLQYSLNNGRISRWPSSIMPLVVYVSPFKWYKAKSEAESYRYKQMVMDAFSTWQNLSGNAVSFVFTSVMNESHINVEWKRVDRKALGHCHFNYDKSGRFYSAEVQIGLSDGILHKRYMQEDEVYHTILHEVGHAVGLGHSPNKADIMYTPHQYGITKLSRGDIDTLKWLYKFEVGLTPQEIISKYPEAKAPDLDLLVAALMGQKSQFAKTMEQVAQVPERDILQESHNIGELKKYLLELNKISLKRPRV